MRPLLVGELNPYGSAPEYALFPLPENSAGGRLCRRILGLGVTQYLRSFDRVNLCTGRWSLPAARKKAREIGEELRAGLRTGPDARTLVLLGSKVCAAFLVPFEPFAFREAGNCDLIVLPHPSGRCRFWNEPGAIEKARELVMPHIKPRVPVITEADLAYERGYDGDC